MWAIGATVFGTGIAYLVYSKDTAFSYAVGALGGIVYLRLLGKSVDSCKYPGHVTFAVATQKLCLILCLILYYL